MRDNNYRAILHESQEKLLSKGKLGRIGVIDNIRAVHYGKSDGRHGLLKRTEEGWQSPWIRRKYAEYEEFCDRAWGEIELIIDQEFIETRKLSSEIDREKENLKELASQKKLTPTEEELNTKLAGEESLSDDQVRRRRQRKWTEADNRRNAGIASSKGAISSMMAELEQRRSYIVETVNITRIICERVRNHLDQIISIYWRAAFIGRDENLADMPIHPKPLPPVSQAEKSFVEMHKEILECITISETNEEIEERR